MTPNMSWQRWKDRLPCLDQWGGPHVCPSDVILALMALAAAFFAVSGRPYPR